MDGKPWISHNAKLIMREPSNLLHLPTYRAVVQTDNFTSEHINKFVLITIKLYVLSKKL